jgi:hypothetical protein
LCFSQEFTLAFDPATGDWSPNTGVVVDTLKFGTMDPYAYGVGCRHDVIPTGMISAFHHLVGNPKFTMYNPIGIVF